MLKTKVILLNVTNLSDARYAAGMGVDHIGFAINPVSNHYVTAKDVNTITEWISGVSLIGNIGQSLPPYTEYKIDYLLTENIELVDELDEPILSIELTPENTDLVRATIKDFNSKVSFFIIKVKAEDIEKLKEEISLLNSEAECYYSTELTEDKLELLLATQPTGIVLHGSYEEKPGLSNYEGIADILEFLEQ